jgi:hypothetical protein
MRVLGVSVGVLVAIVAALAAYVFTAPPMPYSSVSQPARAGATELIVDTVAPFTVGEAVVVDVGDDTTRATVVGVDGARGVLTLDKALRGDTAAGSQVTRADAATTVAVFDSRVGLRRFPRVDSRTYAHARAGMSKRVMAFADDWAKIEIARPVVGWAMAESSRVVHSGIVDEVAFSSRVAVRPLPYRDEALVRWEGRVVKKTAAPGDDGEPDYALEAVDAEEEPRVFHLTQPAWNSFRERDYVVDREGLGLAQADSPVGFTDLGPPYEVLARDGERVKIQWQDQGWIRADSCRFEVRYNYSTSRRQDVAQVSRRWLRRLLGHR